MSEKTVNLADRLRKNFSGPMSEPEIAFCRDVQGFIEFAIRNGLSFSMIVSNVGHDLNNLAREGFDLSAAKATGFLPKVTGYSKITAEDFAQSEEPSA